MNHDDHDDHDDHGGLRRDLSQLSRRQVLGVFAGAGAAGFLITCASDDGGIDITPDAGGGDGTCAKIPAETAGPFPGDGTNGKNALTEAGIVRADIRPSFDGATGVADGIVLELTLAIASSGSAGARSTPEGSAESIVDSSTCAPLVGHAVYVWHCDSDGNYSMYTPAIANENYLRGVQITDADGKVTFTTIFPGCYAGRWPHIHLEVYASAAAATSGTNAIATSQLALPKSACDEVYASAGYTGSASNLSRISLSTDNVFSDGATRQLATISATADGYAATLTVAV
jgi:protocatechuate 3,4-dioxygenase beta subunit